MEPAEQEILSEDEYLAREERSLEKHEFIDGHVIAMAGGSPRHSLIAANVARALGNRLQDRPCLVFNSDLRVNVGKARFYTYPDVTVVCGKAERHPKSQSTITNPMVVIEVLSDATRAYDRGKKFDYYRKLPSLQEYLLVWQAEPRVQHYRRMEVGWLLTDFEAEQSVAMPVLGIELPLVEIYDKVELLAETDRLDDEEDQEA